MRQHSSAITPMVSGVLLDENEVELVYLKDIATSESVPYEVSKQALDCFFKFADPPDARDEKGLTVPAILAGKRFEVEDLGTMDEERIEAACCYLANVADVSEFDDDFIERAMETADRNGSNDIDFVEFLSFYYQFSFSEEVLLGKEERQMRKIARKYELDLLVMDKFMKQFNDADTDRSGLIEYDEFCEVVTQLLKIPKSIGLPEKKLQDMWRAARGPSSRSETLDFDGFVGFYLKNFEIDSLMKQ